MKNMPDWFKLYRTFSSNSKIQRLRQSVSQSVVRVDAVNDVLVQGMVVRLWLWCNDRTVYIKKTKHREGSLNNGYIFTASKINDAEYAIGWAGEPGGFIKACIECGLIDDLGGENGEHRYQIHNWERYAGALMDAMRKRAAGTPTCDIQEDPGCSRMFPTSSPLLSSSLLSSELVDSVNTSNAYTSNREVEVSDLPVSSTDLGLDGAVQQVFCHWKSHHPRCRLQRLPVTDEAHVLVRQALKAGFSIEDCKKAVDGFHNSAFHQGANEDNQKYNTMAIIFANVSRVQKGIDMAHSSLESSMLGKDGVAKAVKLQKWINEGSTKLLEDK